MLKRVRQIKNTINALNVDLVENDCHTASLTHYCIAFQIWDTYFDGKL